MQESTDIRQSRLQEYAALREEILFALRSRVWGVATYAVFAAGALTLADKTGSSLAWVGPIAFATPFLWYTTYVERQRVRISAYIAAVIEPNVPGLEYARSLEAWRRKQPSKRPHKDGIPDSLLDRLKYMIAMVGVPDLVALYCFCKLCFGNVPWYARVLALLSFLMVFHGHFALSDVLSRRRYEKFHSDFRAIRQSKSDNPAEPPEQAVANSNKLKKD